MSDELANRIELGRHLFDPHAYDCIHGNSCFTCKDCTIKELQRTCAKMREERKAFCEALIEIAKIRLEPGYCYEQSVRMQEIAKTVLRRGEG